MYAYLKNWPWSLSLLLQIVCYSLASQLLLIILQCAWRERTCFLRTRNYLYMAYCETRTRTRTRTRTKPGLEKNPDSTLGLTLEKSRTCLQKTRTRLIKKTEFKTGLIKKRSFKSVARQSVICLHLIPEWAWKFMLHALLRTHLAKIKDHKCWRLFRTKVASVPTMHSKAHKNVCFFN